MLIDTKTLFNIYFHIKRLSTQSRKLYSVLQIRLRDSIYTQQNYKLYTVDSVTAWMLFDMNLYSVLEDTCLNNFVTIN